MKKYFILGGIVLLFFVVIFGFNKKEKSAIKIGDISISPQEFEAAFKAASVSDTTNEDRENFLERYISRKLILKEAEKLGFDKDPQFLENVQMFWEQTLLKNILAQKTKELANTVRVADNDIVAYYEKRKETNFADKSLQEVYGQIKWMLLKQKQSKTLQEWIESLKRNVKIEADYNLLGIN